MKKILFVDDEKRILKSLRRLFYNSDYNCFFASGSKEALKILKEYKINLIITDIRMPKMDGFELLKKVKKHYPKVTRVALSGYTDKDAIMEAIEANLIKLYLYKPWKNEELKEIVYKTFMLEDVLNSKKIFEFINDLDSLPTVPTLFKEINHLIEKKADVKKITKKIEKDQSLASKILHVANSAYYNAKTGSISKAIMYIGLLNVKNIVLANAVFDNQTNDSIDLLWKHANITNKMAGYIYKKLLLKKIPNNYSSAGLLHDIGRVVLMTFAEDENEKINILMNKTPIDLDSRLNYEKKLVNVTHQKIGAYLLNWWEIPLPIVESALYHHDPLNEMVINKELVSVIYLANNWSWKLLKPKDDRLSIDKKVLEFLKIPEEKFYEKIDEFEI
ncbi:MAG: HDOD domain-containing protein [Bacillota bacterium]